MPIDFSATPDRRQTHSAKWTFYPEDVIPLWVADMDFPSPAPILRAIQSALDPGVLGYEMPTLALRQTVAARMARVHGWEVDPDWVIATPGVIAGFNAAAQAVCQRGQGILIQPPAYPPFLSVHAHAGLVQQTAPLAPRLQGGRLRYEIDWEVFRAAFHSGGARTGMFLLCHPHNPTGHSYTREELLGMAESCLANDVVICSDEIHNELILSGGQHMPLALLSPEIAARSITLVAPSKTFNIPGLFCAFAIIPDAGLRARYKQATERMAMHISSLSLIAAQAAFGGECDDWLGQLLVYLSASRDLLAERIAHDLPGVRMTVPEATYMSWLDCSQLVADGRIVGSPKKFFLDHARVALTDGADFGPGYEHCVRLVFGCSQATLHEALERMRRALSEGAGGLG